MKHLVNMTAKKVQQDYKAANRKKHKNNKSNFSGICYDKLRNRYKVRVMINKRSKHLGYFKELWDSICCKQSYLNQRGLIE